MKIGWILAAIAAVLYFLFKNQAATSNPASCTTCGSTVGIVATPDATTQVPLAPAATTQPCFGVDCDYLGIQTATPQPILEGPVTVPAPPSSPGHPILAASGDPALQTFFSRGTPTAAYL
jgi:hypothetical protein